MHGIREEAIRSVGELIEAVTPKDRDPQTGRYRDNGVYRGSSHVTWHLLTSLDRLGGAEPAHTKADLEGHILRNFQRYSRPFLDADPANEWELLVVARHHGLPTRLMDWSYSPLVAAHFATVKPQFDDRVIWRLDWQAVHRHFGLRPLAYLLTDFEQMLRERETDLHSLLEGRNSADFRFACMVEPPMLDQRLTAQSATFMITSDKTKSIDEFLVGEGLAETLTRFVIPADCRDIVRDQLDLCGIDERRLFPDLDGVAAQMRRYYS